MPDSALPGKRVVKRFRVAREGQTVDGRTLSQEQIIDMSETYDPVEYTARINCEHMSDYWSGLNGRNNEGALGDIIKVDHAVETFVQNGSNVQLMCLYATLSVLPTLVDANKEGKKIFTSIEFYPKFADTGRAYLVGLAVTDRPASRGTEPLKFSTKDNALRTNPNDQELILMTKDKTTTAHDDQNTDQATPPVDDTQELNNKSNEDGFLQKLSSMFASKKSGMSQQEQDLVLDSFSQVNQKADKAIEENKSLKTELSELKTEFESLKTQLSSEPAVNLTNTPPNPGTGGQLTAF